MAVRVLSGIIVCGAPVSFVRIGFNPHQVLETDPNSSATTVSERRAIGPARDFVSTPAKHVALRQLVFQTRGGGGQSVHEELVVNDAISATELRVSWNAAVDLNTDFSQIVPVEISYMVIGEVPDA